MSEEQKSAPASEAPASASEDKHSLVISPTRSSVEDDRETCNLRVILRDEFKIEETADRSSLLRNVLSKLHSLIKNWVHQTAAKKKLAPETVAKASGELYISGSLKLGVHGSSSDVDALCVVPRFVDGDDDFFGDFLETLRKNSDIKDLRGIKDAYVPLIKMKFCSVDIDLLFARLRFESVDETVRSLKDDCVLRDCDEQSVNSLNTYRNNDLILGLVPNQENFTITLKCIKVWAKRRDLYSNKVGYLGGISWAILVAKICQFFPYLAPNRLLEKFFSAFYKWKWRIPVLLCEIKEPKDSTLPNKQWNPKLSEGDQQQGMPIITPAFPCVNSAFNVSKTTKKILIQEFYRAARIAKKVNAHKPRFTWMSLFKKYDFFKKYSHYLRIDSLSHNEEDHLKWEGFVESKLRLLIQELETCDQDICQIRPYTKPFYLPDPEYKCCTTFLFGFKFRDPQKPPNYNQEYVVDLRAPILKFCEKIMGMYHRPNKATNMRITHVTRDKLPNEVFENGIRPHFPPVKRQTGVKVNSWIDQQKKIKFDIPVDTVPFLDAIQEENL